MTPQFARTTLGTIVTGLVIACGTTEPRDPLAGTYDLTATLDSFSFETGTPDPDCPDAYLYCYHQRSETRATLTGSFVVDERQTDARGDVFLPASGEVEGSFCSSFNRDGCNALSPKHIVYSVGIFMPDPPDAFIQLSQDDTTGEFRLLLRPTIVTADSLAGDVAWQAYSYRNPPKHTGHFVARKRR